MSARHPPHPSRYSLDRVAKANEMEALEGLVGDCAECAEHVGRVRTRESTVPSWVADLGRERTSLLERIWRPRWASGVVVAAASLAVALWVVRPTGEPVHEGFRAKGAPSVLAFIRQGTQVQQWDGQTSLRAGDSVRLQVFPADYTFVTVLAPGPTGPGEILFQGAVPPRKSTFLPQGLQVDATRVSSERLLVFLSNHPPRSGGTAFTPAPDDWSAVLVFPKERSP